MGYKTECSGFLARATINPETKTRSIIALRRKSSLLQTD